jgi:hypothetical protein
MLLYNLFQNQKSINSAFYLENTTDNVAYFCFLMCLQVSEKRGVMKENCWTVVLVVVHRVFYSHFIISLKKYDMVAKTLFIFKRHKSDKLCHSNDKIKVSFCVIKHMNSKIDYFMCQIT